MLQGSPRQDQSENPQNSARNEENPDENSMPPVLPPHNYHKNLSNQKAVVPIIAAPQKVKTPRITVALNKNVEPLLDIKNEEERKSMKSLRKSVEGQITAIMKKEAERKTDPTTADDEDDFNGDVENENQEEEQNVSNSDDNIECGDLNDENINENEIIDDFENAAEEDDKENVNEMNPDVSTPDDDDDEHLDKIGTTILTKLNSENNKDNQFENKEEMQKENKEEIQKVSKYSQIETQTETDFIQPITCGSENVGNIDKSSNGQLNDENDAKIEETNETNNEELNDTKQDDNEKLLITQVDGAVEGQDSQRTRTVTTPDGIRITDATSNLLVPILDLENQDIDQKSSAQQSSTSKINSSIPSSAAASPLFTDDDIISAFEEFQKNKTVPPLYMRDAIIIYIKNLQETAIEEENYDYAEKLEQDMNELISSFNAESSRAIAMQPPGLENRLEEVKNQRMAAEAEWEAKIKRLKESEKKKVEELEAKQALERSEFEERCQTQEFLQKFTKPSARLLQMWKLQKGLALQHDFEGAKEMKARAEALQIKETQEAQKRAIASVKINYEKLVKKQQNELDCAVANGKRKVRQMQLEMKKDLENRDKLSRQVETRMKEWRPPLKKSLLPPLATREAASTAAFSKRAASRNKRTITTAEPANVLDIKISNIKSVLGTRPKQHFT